MQCDKQRQLLCGNVLSYHPGMAALPIIDLAPLRLTPDSSAARATIAELTAACRAPGFCYLTNHGIDPEVEAAAQHAANRFFALPAAQREALAIGNSPHFRGYTLLGDERTQGISDWRDQLDVGPEEPALELTPESPAWLKLRGPNQWPQALPEMAPATLAWMAQMETLGLCIMRGLARGLGQSQSVFDDYVLPDPDVHVKIIRYPEQNKTADTGQGVGLHHDSGLLSFILQDAVAGLEVQTEQGLVLAEPIPGTYVMNLGEMLQAGSGGYLRATKHRVKSPPPNQQRLSLAYFYNPRLEAVFEPVELPQALAAQVEALPVRDSNDPIHASFGDNTLKIRLRAHPDVRARFYR